MATASLSTEEENYVRMSLLLTGVSPRGVRTLFDSEYAPKCLDASIKKEYTKLKDLQLKNRINQAQWNLLFPRYPDVPDSKTFDVTLMITLLRNLTPMTPPAGGYDLLPPTIEVTPGADLARIKHYRNYLAHLDDGRIEIAFFITAWTDITGAIHRLGGQKLKEECDQLRTKHLDQANQEIIMDIKRSSDEIKELKGLFENLKLSHLELKKSNEEVKQSHALLQDKVATYQQDTVPWNVRAQFNSVLEKWKYKDEMFVSTRAATNVLNSLQDNSCVTITASSGVGKTAILQHVALQLGADGYDILLVTDPGDIGKYYNPTQKSLFVIDNFCGNFCLNQADFKLWEPVNERLKVILEDKTTKIIVACRLQVYQDDKFDTLSIFKSCVCNLLSPKMCLLNTEKRAMAELYLKSKAHEIIDYYDLHDCFPLLCQLYHENPALDIKQFFQNPFSVYEAQVDQLQKRGCFGKYCALALCVLFNNKVKEHLLTGEIDEETKHRIENLCETCKLDRSTSRHILKDEMDSLSNTFLKKQLYFVSPDSKNYTPNSPTRSFYTTIHDKIFDFLAKYFGEKILDCLIKNADSRLIRERFLFEANDAMGQFITLVPFKYHQMYIQRMIDDWSNGKLQDVFDNINMKMHRFRQRFLNYLNTLNISFQQQLAHTWNEDVYKTLKTFFCDDDVVCDTAMLWCCSIGDISMIQWCFSRGVDAQKLGILGQSPLLIACRNGNTKLARMLLNIGVDYNSCDLRYRLPIMMACIYGHTELVRMLLDKGADYNKFEECDESPLLIACEHGHTEIVKMLLDQGADYNQYDADGLSPVMKGCEEGHSEIVRMLLDKGANFNDCDWRKQSPLIIACKHGHTEIVRMLLNAGADHKKMDNDGQSLVMIVCENGYTDIMCMLLNKDADFDEINKCGRSPVMVASKHGQTEIVRMLLHEGVAYNRCDKFGDSSVSLACICQNTEIVRMLLDKGASYDTCDKDGKSCLMKACEHGNSVIVSMLIDKGADISKCDKDNLSPVMMACRQGHTEILKILLYEGAIFDNCDKLGDTPVSLAVKCHHTETVRILLDKGANYEKNDWRDQTPLIKACELGYLDIVRMLVDKGADYSKCDNYGQSPLIMACRNGHKDIVRMLLYEGADYTTCDQGGFSPVSLACICQNAEIVKMLLDKGADYDKCDNYFYQSPLMIACEHGYIDIVRLLLDKGADHSKCDKDGKSPIMTACSNGHTKVVRMLLLIGADYNMCDLRGNSPVMIACRYRHTEILRILFDKGADFEKCDNSGKSPVINASEHGEIEVLKMLLDQGASINKCDLSKTTPLIIACKHGQREIVRMLLDKGADCNTFDQRGWSPIRIACEHNYIQIVRMLLDKGAKFDKHDIWCRSLFIMAYRDDRTEIIRMLFPEKA